MKEVLLEVNHLKTQFSTDEGIAHAVEDVSFTVKKGETLGIVGESGSGKSVTALSIMQLVTGDIKNGEALFDGKDLLKLSEKQMQKVRGGDIAMIFQDPMTSLDPVYTIGFQMIEAIRLHKRISKDDARKIAVSMLKKVGIRDPEGCLKDYPHQLSGGMRQRIMIAMGLCCNPKLLIADEPTTALDVTIQAQILELMRQLKQDSDMSIILITHDLGVVAQMCDRICIMYCGEIVETGTVHDIFKNPKHRYTIDLLNSIPRMDKQADRLNVIEGSVPNIVELPTGCRFHPRCTKACAVCSERKPELKQVGQEHYAACHLLNDGEEVSLKQEETKSLK